MKSRNLSKSDDEGIIFSRNMMVAVSDFEILAISFFLRRFTISFSENVEKRHNR